MAPSPDKAPSPDSSVSPPSDSDSSSPPPQSSPSPPPTSSPPQKSPPPPENSPPPPSPPSPDSSPPPPSSDSSNNPSPSPPPKSDSPVPPSPPKSSPPRTPTPSDALSPPPPRSSEKSSPSNESPSKGDNDSNSPSPNKHSSHDLNVPLIAGIAAAVGLLFLLMLISACLCCKKKRRKHHNSMHYYADSGPNGDYYNAVPPPKWQNGNQGMDHGSKLPPPPGGGGMWHQPSTMMNSSDMSSNYSAPHGPALPPPSPALALGFNKSTFSYDELAAATGGFAQSNLLGQGGFGYVYKGLLPNGKDIAVKQLKSGSGQGEREFQAEVDIISRVHHRHLVSLVGYCIAGAHRMLVYEYLPNKTLEYHLHGKGLPVMDWPTRLRIALGSAKGLAYLHEDCHPRIIHRDIKAANILLDNNFEAMVADFGLAKLSQDNYTHVSTRIMGTFGYMAPEYASSGKLTDKSDVFSYGVMLLELITGRRPVDSAQMEDSLVDWARPLLSRALAEGIYEELVDPRLEGNYNTTEMARMVSSAAASVRHSAKRRSKMSQIVRALEGDVSLDDLNEGVKPGQSGMFSSGSDFNSSPYSSDMKRFKQVALASNEFSEEYGPTSEYGLNASASSSSGESHIGSRNKPPLPRLVL